jgi:hypothetical protein
MTDDAPRKPIHVDLPLKPQKGMVEVVHVGPHGAEMVSVTVEQAIAILLDGQAAVWLVTDTRGAEVPPQAPESPAP